LYPVKAITAGTPAAAQASIVRLVRSITSGW
jgi:hypothetical protein